MGWMTSLVAAVVFGACHASRSTKEPPVVTVKEGKLRGSIEPLLDGRGTFYSFKGIPYATPPVGELRFRAPLPPQKWSGIRNATDHGPVCTHFDTNINQIVEGSEDCLFLNVYSKNLRSKAPVMVYIHGGGFMSGSGNTDTYGPHFLLPVSEIVLVTLNYRLEVLGFLSLDTPEVPGNAGLKDQVAALRWVKENIAQFGGDPNKVTIFGESSGGSAVTYHMLSPMSKGLFHRAIAQSGTCLQDEALAVRVKERAFAVGKVLGKDTKDVNELLQFLRSVPAVQLANMTAKTMSPDENIRGPLVHFVPNVEKNFHNVEYFINDNPISLMLAKKVNEVPLIIGYNTGEGLLLLEDQLKKSQEINAQPSYLVPREIAIKVPENKMKEFGDRILNYYTSGKPLSNETANAIVDMQTDIVFSYSTYRFINLYKKTNAPVYMYSFAYETELNIVKIFLGYKSRKGACHADDIFYLFYNELNREAYANNEQRLRPVVQGLARLWTNFAKAGDPTPNNVEPAQKWKQYTTTNKEYFILNEMMSTGKYLDQNRIEFWNTMYCEAGLYCF